MKHLLVALVALAIVPAAASASVQVNGWDNATPFKAHIASAGTWVNDASFAAPVYQQCVPWRWPYNPCDAGHDRINVRQVSWDGTTWAPELSAKWENTPVPSGFKPANGSDAQAVVVNYIENRYSEFWGMRKDSSGQWVAVWGGSEPFDAFTYPDGLRVWPTSEHFYGTAASGIAMVPGLILLDDLKQNYIDHPVMFSVPNACQHYKPPATREDGMGGADCIQYGAKIKLPASINVDAIRSDSRWCAPGPSHYNGSGGGRSLAEAQAAGWDAQTETCPLPPLARMLARVMQDRFIVATDQTYWGGPITFSVESYDRPRTGNWTGVPAGNPYGPYTGCDGIQGTGQWQPDTNTIGKPVAAGDWEQDCAQTPSAAWKGFPWDQAFEVQ
jgi:hypothetical protein